ncbi:hypothetical protein F4703DRAFT_1792717 [Phycomyces blakesleeanus]|uniref:Uncharacterized protein n=1 Tax=Phycomyces blakesleeanus (strain ATCC 8743b / DSM 1359 / FGSC 10004 / NBRC 33097 / NRRL 1555) TaxID=763407 RepID=A0A162V8W1_PHYB8|nr:hypothetical protein PHYBLDRAFT_61987 [Phycomyces blakesleeanus NRRL 1555(-)]OAD80943.1 hypothetical protein PHYBLDRAFT_61987 [Phycomyces blakesleeanus NRRL 1555(-)]|eukprot:XP_018298983.1 hypothetical protein PHYBLDRAFT_61987 [Phycomyces blakesleeanus NRRL 1555(-)]
MLIKKKDNKLIDSETDKKSFERARGIRIHRNEYDHTLDIHDKLNKDILIKTQQNTIKRCQLKKFYKCYISSYIKGLKIDCIYGIIYGIKIKCLIIRTRPRTAHFSVVFDVWLLLYLGVSIYLGSLQHQNQNLNQVENSLLQTSLTYITLFAIPGLLISSDIYNQPSLSVIPIIPNPLSFE